MDNQINNTFEKNDGYEKQKNVTILTIFKVFIVLFPICCAAGIFLPIFKIELNNVQSQEYSLIHFFQNDDLINDIASAAFLRGLIINSFLTVVAVFPELIITKIYNNIVKKGKKQTKITFIRFFAVIGFCLTFILAVSNFTLIQISSCLDVPKEMISIGLGSILCYIGAVGSFLVLISLVFTMDFKN